MHLRTRWCGARCRALGSAVYSNRRRRAQLTLGAQAYQALVRAAEQRQCSLGELIGQMLEAAAALELRARQG
jgi:predicted DNA-binding ribbon-helix-helix protein